MLSRKRKYPFGTLSEDLSMKWKTDVSENSLVLQGLVSGRNYTENYLIKNTYTDKVDVECYQRTDVVKIPSNHKLEGMEVQHSFDQRQTDVCDFTAKDGVSSIKSDVKTSTPCSRCQAGEPVSSVVKIQVPEQYKKIWTYTAPTSLLKKDLAECPV